MTITISNGGGLMTNIIGRNVNEIWAAAVPVLAKGGRAQSSRAGDVIVMDNPVMSVYEKPCERVLFDPVRDANPFFHFFEFIWMMEGSHHAKFLNKFVHDFGTRFAEPKTGILHGAYGYRWRYQFDEMDQLDVVVNRLKNNHDDRRAVIAMWSPNDDCLDPTLINDDTGKPWPEPIDLPCNTHIYLRVRGERGQVATGHGNVEDYDHRVLDLTVMCRSNDIVWGAYGANAVHFSFLQEWLAASIGVGVGRMYQLSNNWHAYKNTMPKEFPDISHPYEGSVVEPFPLLADPSKWAEDLKTFAKWSCLPSEELADIPQFGNPWFPHVACQMYMTHDCFKVLGPADAQDVAEQIAASDWRLAAYQWLQRRIDRQNAKEAASNVK